MKSLLIFLNELSFLSPNPSREAMIQPVLSTLATIKAAKDIRKDITVATNVRLPGVMLGDGTRSLAEVLGTDDYRDQWRFLQALDQSSPWDAYPGSTKPGDFQEMKFQGQIAVGMLWARQNNSSVVSFPFSTIWDGDHLQAQFCEMDEQEKITVNDVEIRNMSRPEHVRTHRNFINNYGRSISVSSLVHEGDGFRIRMYFNDHHPLPHFHVFGANAPESLASYAIETLDLLSGELSPALRRKVTDWAASKRDALMACWERCRAGDYPLLLDE